MRLSHADFAAFHNAILQLHDLRDLETFRRAVPDILLKVVRADYLNYADFVPRSGSKRVLLKDSFESEKRFNSEARDFAERHLHSHPFAPGFIGSGWRRALKLSDFQHCKATRRSPWPEGLRRFFDARWMLSIAVESGCGVAAFSLVRRSMDFNERDRILLNLLRPHYDQACRNVERLGRPRIHSPCAIRSFDLSPRETEIAGFLLEGKSNPEIAIILRLSPRTVDKHMERILAKLGVENRTAAALVLSCLAAEDVARHPPPRLHPEPRLQPGH